MSMLLMSNQISVICLALSRKLQGHCVAGKQILEDGTVGQWVRPVSNSATGELSHSHIRYLGNAQPRLLDVIRLSVKKHSPHYYQQENFLNDEGSLWTKIDEWPRQELAHLLDDPDSLWNLGYCSYNGINDRVPEILAKESISNSLLLVQPSTFHVVIGRELEKRRARAVFEYKGNQYKLMITDNAFEDASFKKEDGTYPFNPHNWVLCVSLGEAYKEFCYKLVAGMIRMDGETQ